MITSPNKNLTLWMQRYEPRLRNYLVSRINRADVDDLIQDIFIRVQLRQQEQAISNPRSYIFAVARNLLINRYRRQRILGRVFHDGSVQEMEIPDLISPERTAIGKQEYCRALRAILQLPPRARTAFQLHRFEEMSYREVAEHMKISRESVKELIQRALKRVRGVMKD
ncbi:MAG: RNA polymerase sigma factor [Gammaproteobacteria bacterium]|nr:RNA polymerase sigma factor [Gammaproteobacteria bacterium]